MPAVDVRETRLTEIYQILRSYAQSHAFELKYLQTDQEDFVQDVITNIYRRRGFDRYDETKVRSFEALVRFCAHGRLVDMKKARFGAKSRLTPEGKPFVFISLATPLGEDSEDGGWTVADTIEGEPEMEILLAELASDIPDIQISPNYDLSWRELMSRSYRESPAEIASSVGISESRVQQLQSEMQSRFFKKDQPSKGWHSTVGPLSDDKILSWDAMRKNLREKGILIKN